MIQHNDNKSIFYWLGFSIGFIYKFMWATLKTMLILFIAMFSVFIEGEKK